MSVQSLLLSNRSTFILHLPNFLRPNRMDFIFFPTGGKNERRLNSRQHRTETEDSHGTESPSILLLQQGQAYPAGPLWSPVLKSNVFSVCDTASATVSHVPWQRCVLVFLGPHPQWLQPSDRLCTANDSWDSGTSVPEEQAMLYAVEEVSHDSRRLDS